MKIKNIIIVVLLFFSCSGNEGIKNNEEDPFEKCYKIVSAGTSSPFIVCDSGIYFAVVSYYDYLEGNLSRNFRTYICVTSSEFSLNDFSLGKVICDLTIYN